MNDLAEQIEIDGEQPEDQEEQQEQQEQKEPTEEEKRKLEQDGVQKAINKQHRKFREEERRRIAAEERVKELEQRVGTQPGKPTIPPMPEPFDSDFKEKVKAREEAIIKVDRWEREQAEKQTAEQKRTEETQKQQQERIQKLLATFDKNAAEAKIDPVEMKQSADIVATYGLNQNIVTFLLEDKDGPALVNYLARNPHEIDTLTDLPPIYAALHLKTVVLPKAVESKARTVSNAPPPPGIRKGSQKGDTEPLLKGVSFE